jgi:hypothetical protein
LFNFVGQIENVAGNISELMRAREIAVQRLICRGLTKDEVNYLLERRRYWTPALAEEFCRLTRCGHFTLTLIDTWCSIEQVPVVLDLICNGVADKQFVEVRAILFKTVSEYLIGLSEKGKEALVREYLKVLIVCDVWDDDQLELFARRLLDNIYSVPDDLRFVSEHISDFRYSGHGPGFRNGKVVTVAPPTSSDAILHAPAGVRGENV